MDITYTGVGSVKIASKSLSILCDPYGESYGLPKLKNQSDVTLITDPDNREAPRSGMVIDGPGEYEVKGAMILGVPVRRHIDESGIAGTAYRVEVDGVSVVFTGNMAGDISGHQAEELGDCDVLIIPVGGHGLTLDATAAAALISRLEPRIVIPTHYADDKTTYPMPQEEVGKFLAEMGVKAESLPKLRVTARDLPEETAVVVLERV